MIVFWKSGGYGENLSGIEKRLYFNVVADANISEGKKL